MMLQDWIKIGKRRQKLIDKIIALDSSRSLQQLSKWPVHNLEKELFFLEYYPNRYIHRSQYLESSPEVSRRIDILIKKAKKDKMWENNPKEGKWV